MEIRTGQVMEFVVPATVEGRAIPRGTRIRIGHIMGEILDPKLTIVFLDAELPETLVVGRHDVARNCRVVAES